MAIFYCHEREKEVDHLYEHGYCVGGRLLEPLYFKVSLKDSGKVKTREALEPADFDVEWVENSFSDQLNMEYWTEQALKHCPTIDEGMRDKGGGHFSGAIFIYTSIDEVPT